MRSSLRSSWKSAAVIPARLPSSISSDLVPSISSSRLRRARSLISALVCISARPASVLTQITRSAPFPIGGSRAAASTWAEMYQHPSACGPSRTSEISRFVAQFPTQDLADGRLRQLVAELDHLRPLVAGEVGLAVGAHLRLGDRRILADDEELHRLARLLVGNADRGALE